MPADGEDGGAEVPVDAPALAPAAQPELEPAAAARRKQTKLNRVPVLELPRLNAIGSCLVTLSRR